MRPDRPSIAALLCALACVALAAPAAADAKRAGRGRARTQQTNRARARARASEPRRLPFELTLTGRSEMRWTERSDQAIACYRVVRDFAGSDVWSVRTRQPARVWLIELDDERLIRLLYPDGEDGVVVGGSWERKVSGGWEQHPQPSGNCHNLRYEHGPHPDGGDCKMVLPQQPAWLQLGFTSAYGVFETPTNLPKRPFGDCPYWGPTTLGPPEYEGDMGSAPMSARALLRLRPGASITLRQRKVAPPSAMPPFTREGWFSWEARLTRLKDVRPAR